jgi:hypothetical protein
MLTEERVGKLPKHERIRFRPREISGLGSFPSARHPGLPPRRRHLIGRTFRGAVLCFGVLAALVCIAVAGIYVMGASRFGSEQLRQAAESQLSALTGFDVDAHIGSTRLSLDSSRFIALEARDVTLKARDRDEKIHAGLVRFGIRFLPLLSGRLRLGSATLADARVTVGAMQGGGGDWSDALKDKNGLLDSDRILAAAFDAFHKAFAALDAGRTRTISLSDVDITLPDGAPAAKLHIDDLTLSRSLTGGLQLSGNLDAAGMAMTLAGSAARNRAGGISSLSLKVSAKRLHPEEAARPPPGDSARVGPVNDFVITLAGHEHDKSGPARLSADVGFNDALVDFGEDGAASLSGDVSLLLAEHVPKITVSRLLLTAGRTRLNFQGEVEPVSSVKAGGNGPSYRYSLVSSDSIAAPADSPEPAVAFMARVSGEYHSASRELTLAQIDVRTLGGEMGGTGAVVFAPGKAPGMFLALSVPKVPLQQVKQLWPWFAAAPARNWVLDNVFGGDVTNSTLQFRVATGRLGNGIPLNDDEIFGHFQVSRTRFDVAGKIPPIRDGDGIIDFRGTDVDISLSHGTVYLPSGKTVDASNGTLQLRHVNVPPLIGSLELDVAGDAAAITELASYDPIDAMSKIDFAPDDFSGKVSGHVTAQVPLSRGVPPETLDWKVSLDYAGLSVAKPIDGQTVSDANGTIVIEPGHADIDAQARLNGIPASVSLLEPFGEDAAQKAERKITLVLNDRDRAKLLPGLDTILSGPVSVDIDASPGHPETVKADLGKAKLTLPWVGWSKGAGIPATVSFLLERNGRMTTLSSFKLASKSFGASGTIRLSGDSLSEAHFPSLSLNSQDDVAVDVKRAGNGYSVSVKGDAFDARPLIKKLSSRSSARAAEEVSGGSPISITAAVDQVTGFNDEVLKKLNLSYRSPGSGLGDLSVTALSNSGAKVSIETSSPHQSKSVELDAADAGALLRFLDIYDHMRGGTIRMSLAGTGDGPLHGEAVVKDFTVVNEPRLRSLVSTPAPAPAGERRSLDQALNRKIDVSVVPFERAAAHIEKGDGYLKLDQGVIRGPVIGTTFQGTMYDKQGNMDMTGTFMPAYGLNRLFADIPIVGLLLGNGRDRGLIGITYKLSGDAKKPTLRVNPVSLIAPGIFRSIFEYQ